MYKKMQYNLPWPARARGARSQHCVCVCAGKTKGHFLWAIKGAAAAADKVRAHI